MSVSTTARQTNFLSLRLQASRVRDKRSGCLALQVSLSLSNKRGTAAWHLLQQQPKHPLTCSSHHRGMPPSWCKSHESPPSTFQNPAHAPRLLAAPGATRHQRQRCTISLSLSPSLAFLPTPSLSRPPSLLPLPHPPPPSLSPANQLPPFLTSCLSRLSPSPSPSLVVAARSLTHPPSLPTLYHPTQQM